MATTAVLELGSLSAFATGVWLGMYFDLLERFGPLSVNLVTYLDPIVAVIVGWLLLGE